jgi:REP element-mobilizing transposase RayT
MKPKQLDFNEHRRRNATGPGGFRKGAGRPARRKGTVHHIRRPGVKTGCPAHVTIRVREDVPSLRKRSFVQEFQRSLGAACERGAFRVVHYSIQSNHVHMIVEASGKQALACGMKSIGSRFARAVNRVFQREGPVLDGRYHLRVLRTPREVRNALAYVLLNARKHWVERRNAKPPARIDEASSGRWFRGWKRDPRGPTQSQGNREVAKARTWLLNTGWRRHGLIDLGEIPGPAHS